MRATDRIAGSRTSTDMVRRVESPCVLGPDGEPYRAPSSNGSTSEVVRKAFATYVSALWNLDSKPIFRATEPFKNHAWVYAAAMARALVFAQAPFVVFRENEDGTDRRRAEMRAIGGKFVCARSGRRRRAQYRHLSRQRHPERYMGATLRELTPDFEHPLSDVFTKPNDAMTGTQLMQATELFLALRGECIWLLLDEDGGRLTSPTDDVGQVWPLAPDLFRPIRKRGHVVGWEYTIKSLRTGVPIGEQPTHRTILEFHEVVQFKYVNPDDPWRGFSPMIPSASAVTLDMKAKRRQSGVLDNGADPGGILVDEGAQKAWEPAEEEEFMRDWNERHSGPENARSLWILPGGLKYIPTGLTPQDLEYLDGMRYDREEILATLRVSKTIVGVTEAINYATQLGQDRNFIEKTIVPEWEMVEQVLDGTMFFGQTDDVVGAFDLSGVEVLRLGQSERIETAKDLSGPALHMPPALAFETVGMGAVAQYDGDDIALVAGSLVTVDQAAEPVEPPPPPPPPEAIAPAPLVEETEQRLTQKERLRYWRALTRTVQQPFEKKYKPRWRKWVKGEKARQLASFDAATRGVGLTAIPVDRLTPNELNTVLTPTTESGARLIEETRATYLAGGEQTFAYTVATDFEGVAVFTIEDPRLQAFFEQRSTAIAGTAPATIQEAIKRSLLEGIQDGETVQELRRRVSTVYDGAASSAKTLQVARTESAGFMNGQREVMFDLQGFDEREWSTAGDEHVRENHQVFGSSGAQKAGFNYMTLVGGSGLLRYPHDSQAPAGEVVNCRCVQIPV